MKMDIDKIEQMLTTKYIGRNIEYHERISSTQVRAKELANDNMQNGSIVIAEMQTEGIGTHGRRWLANKEENILMTIILFPECKLSEIENLTIEIANLLVKILYDLYKIEIVVKVPNDLMLGGKKVAGILTETKAQNEIVKSLFIGVGMNVNQQNFPEEIESIATSLKKETGKNFNREDIVIEFLNRFEKIWKF